MAFSDNSLRLDGKRVPLHLDTRVALDNLIGRGLPGGSQKISVSLLLNSPSILEVLSLELQRSSLWDVDNCQLSLEQVKMCEQVGVFPKVNSILSELMVFELLDLVEVFEVHIDKDYEGEVYLWAYVLDPFKRIWQICLLEYVEGWFELDDEFLESFERYKQLNDY